MTISPQGASPKSPRYYYTDPLAAAWMAKHFGMRFTDTQGVELEWCGEFNCFHLPDGQGLSQAWDGKHFIHPDSLHQLEPQVGDEGIDAFGTQVEFKNGEWRIPHPVASSADEWATSPVSIDKRNGLAFHWPECEAA